MTRRRRAGPAVLIALVLALALPAAAAPVVQQPRGYGHVVGDVLTQRLLLGEGGAAQMPVMPPAARVNAWFDRLPPHIEVDAQGQTWLRLDYQIINAPRDLVQAALPALDISVKSGQALRVPEWPVSIGPLTPDVVTEKGDLQPMRPDVPAAPYPTRSVRLALQGWSALLATTLLGWLGWFVWRNLRDASHLPFARAAREVQRLARAGRLDGPEGWVFLHRAFNEAAGRVVQAESLSTLFASVSYLEPLRPDIERFFSASSQRFFAQAPSGPTGVQLDALSRRLRHAEKRRGGPRA